MPVNETGQHGLAAQIDNLIDLILIEIPLSLGIRFRTHKNDFAVQSCNDVNLFCILNVFSFLHRFRNRVDFTIAVYGVSDLVAAYSCIPPPRIIAMTAAKDSACFFTRFFMNVPPVKN